MESIKSVTKSTKEKSQEFVVHVKSEYDYRFESEYRSEIFEAIKYVCWKRNKVNLPVYGVPDKLKEYHTSKRDISEGNEIDPEEKFRLKGEDTYPEEPAGGMGGQPQGGMGGGPQHGQSFTDMGEVNMELRNARSATLF